MIPNGALASTNLSAKCAASRKISKKDSPLQKVLTLDAADIRCYNVHKESRILSSEGKNMSKREYHLEVASFLENEEKVWTKVGYSGDKEYARGAYDMICFMSKQFFNNSAIKYFRIVDKKGKIIFGEKEGLILVK